MTILTNILGIPDHQTRLLIHNLYNQTPKDEIAGALSLECAPVGQDFRAKVVSGKNSDEYSAYLGDAASRIVQPSVFVRIVGRMRHMNGAKKIFKVYTGS